MKLQAQTLACERDGQRLFHGLEFTLTGGEAMLVTGRNGAGKTSLLRIICGFIEPTCGRIRLHDSPEASSIGQLCHYVAHEDAIKSALTVRENITFWARFFGAGDVDAGLDAFDLGPLAACNTGLLSCGQKRKLTLSRLKLVNRAIWLLDEPATGLDATAQHRLCLHMTHHLAAGGIVIAASHTQLDAPFTVTLDMNDLSAGMT